VDDAFGDDVCPPSLTDENDGFFVSRLKKSSNLLITAAPRTLRGNSIDIEGAQVFDVVGDLASTTSWSPKAKGC